MKLLLTSGGIRNTSIRDVLGALLGKAAPVPHDSRVKDRGPYMRSVRLALRHPGATLALAAFLLVAVQMAYGKFGRGVEFFPNVEPDFGQVIVHGRTVGLLEHKHTPASTLSSTPPTQLLLTNQVWPSQFTSVKMLLLCSALQISVAADGVLHATPVELNVPFIEMLL